MRFPVNIKPQSPARKLLASAAIAFASSLLVTALAHLPGSRVAVLKLDDLLYDTLYRLRPATDQTDGPVVIVVVDDKSLDQLSHQGIGKTSYGWPWPRLFWGTMIPYFQNCGAKAVVFDMMFGEPSVYNDASGDDRTFASAVNAAKVPVIFGLRVEGDGRFGNFAPPVKRPVFGAVNVGDDVVYRSYEPLVYGKPSLAARAVEAVGGRPISEQFLLHYYGPYRTRAGKHTFRYVSAANVLGASIHQKNTGVDPAMFRDKIVLIGTSTIGTFDLKSSPLSAEYPGVEVQATAVQNMLWGQRVQVVAAGWALLAALGASCLAAGGVVFPRRVWLKLLAAGMALAILLGVAAKLFLGHEIHWLPLASPLAALLVATVGAFAWSYMTEGRQRRLVLKALSQYVSPAVAAEIDRDPSALKLGGERRLMTVMFTDIQGFTDLSERLDEHKLTELLNFYLDEMSSLVLASDGTLDKYIGDAIMSFWNAPIRQDQHAALACRAALAMERREREIQPQLEQFGAAGLLTRIGINTGPMVFGNMGSRQKFNYSVLGDAVNLASRLEGANKFYGSRILVAQPTAELVKDQFLLRKLDLLRVKGKQRPMAVFELLGEAGSNGPLDARACGYEAAFALYQQRNWDAALQHLKDLLGRFQEDRPAAALLERIEYLRHQPPDADWDGVYVAKGK